MKHNTNMYQKNNRFSRNGSGRSRGFARGGNRGRSRGPKAEFIDASRYINRAVAGATPEQTAGTITFGTLDINSQLKANIASMGYETPTSIQEHAIPHILAGRDVVGVANTGTGKTAAFLIPTVNKIVTDKTQNALIIAPTRELAVQIQEELHSLISHMNIKTAVAVGGTSMGRQISDIRRRPHILIATPGRLRDLIERRLVQLSQFRTVILDEVDRMVDIGFIREIEYFISLLPQNRQSLFFSATLSGKIGSIVATFLTDPVTVSVKVEDTSRFIDQDVVRLTSGEDKFTKLTSLLSDGEFAKVLIFGKTKWNVERLAKNLQKEGFAAAAIHGNKSQSQRFRVLAQFKRDDVKVLVATDVAARGLDINGVTHVINYDEPTSYTDYVHRIGRTGRAGNFGKALTFVS